MMAGGLVATLLSFGATIVLDVLNAVYVCFALDKDRACITRPEVHAIYVLLPSRCALEKPALTAQGANLNRSHPCLYTDATGAILCV
jgi:hypothetical protein